MKWDDFAARAIGWGPKSQGIAAILSELRVGPEAVLFVDDNHAERLEVGRAIPDVRVLPADGPGEMLAALRFFPGLIRSAVSAEDSLRSADIRANTQREALLRRLGMEDYMRELGIELTFAVNPGERTARVHELLHKTNQFILALKRPSLAELQGYFRAGDRCVVTVSMRDRLSDSGLIAVGLFHAAPGRLVLDELTISCRALGRGVEDGMIRTMLRLAADALRTGPGLCLTYARGPRNKPALDWLQSLGSAPLGQKGELCLASLPAETLQNVDIRLAD